MGTAAAEVVVHAFNNIVAAGGRIFEQHCISIHQHARCAESALNGAVFEEGVLQGMEFVSLRQTFDGHHVLAVYIPDGQAAGANGLFIDDDRAGAAKAHAASKFGSSKSQIRAQNPEERPVTFDIYAGRLSVKGKFDVFIHIDSRGWRF